MSQIPSGCLMKKEGCNKPLQQQVNDDDDGIPNRPHYFSQKDIIGV